MTLGDHTFSPLKLKTELGTGNFKAEVIGQFIVTTTGNGAMVNEWQNVACKKEATRFQIYRNGISV